MAAIVSQERQESQPEDTVELHPLQNSWTYNVFIFKGDGEWDKCIKKVATFTTIEHFWSVMIHTDPPSETKNGTDVYMFLTDIEPKWEHPKNERGGRWLLNMSPSSPVNKYWEELLMLLVGCDWETDEEAAQICGAVFQPRSRGHKMAVWLSNGKDEATIVGIGKRIKERLSYPDKIYFQTVEEQKKSTRGKDINSGSIVL